MPETTECVITRLIKNGMTRFSQKIIYTECINALDIDYYSLDEVKEIFKKVLVKHQKDKKEP